MGRVGSTPISGIFYKGAVMILTMLRTLLNCMAILCLLIILVTLGAMFIPLIGKSLADKDREIQNEKDYKMIKDFNNGKTHP